MEFGAFERSGESRCDPDTGGAVGAIERLVHAAARAMAEDVGGELGVSGVARKLGVSARHLRRSFVRVMGVTPSAFARTLRGERLREELRSGAPLLQATFAAGYRSTHAAYESSALGMTPARFRNGGQGERLRYAIVPSPLGYVVVAATDRGVAWLRIGDSRTKLRRELGDEFPNATLEEDPAALASHCSALQAYLDGSAAWPELPVDIQATAFQARVLGALRQVPSGARVSYEELARSIGAPSAARAVANAVARNPVPLVVPCHRVVRKDGSPGGFSQGPEAKRRLLALESEDRSEQADR